MEDDNSPWNDLVYGETQYNVGAIEGDPVSVLSENLYNLCGLAINHDKYLNVKTFIEYK